MQTRYYLLKCRYINHLTPLSDWYLRTAPTQERMFKQHATQDKSLKEGVGGKIKIAFYCDMYSTFR